MSRHARSLACSPVHCELPKSRWIVRVTVTVAAVWSMRASMSPRLIARTTHGSTSEAGTCSSEYAQGVSQRRGVNAVGRTHCTRTHTGGSASSNVISIIFGLRFRQHKVLSRAPQKTHAQQKLPQMRAHPRTCSAFATASYERTGLAAAREQSVSRRMVSVPCE